MCCRRHIKTLKILVAKPLKCRRTSIYEHIIDSHLRYCIDKACVCNACDAYVIYASQICYITEFYDYTFRKFTLFTVWFILFIRILIQNIVCHNETFYFSIKNIIKNIKLDILNFTQNKL